MIIKYRLGKVSKVVDSRHANVKFDNGVKQEKMSVSNILKMNGSSTYLSVHFNFIYQKKLLYAHIFESFCLMFQTIDILPRLVIT